MSCEMPKKLTNDMRSSSEPGTHTIWTSTSGDETPKIAAQNLSHLHHWGHDKCAAGIEQNENIDPLETSDTVHRGDIRFKPLDEETLPIRVGPWPLKRNGSSSSGGTTAVASDDPSPFCTPTLGRSRQGSSSTNYGTEFFGVDETATVKKSEYALIMEYLDQTHKEIQDALEEAANVFEEQFGESNRSLGQASATERTNDEGKTGATQKENPAMSTESKRDEEQDQSCCQSCSLREQGCQWRLFVLYACFLGVFALPLVLYEFFAGDEIAFLLGRIVNSLGWPFQVFLVIPTLSTGIIWAVAATNMGLTGRRSTYWQTISQGLFWGMSLYSMCLCYIASVGVLNDEY
jgi:hypothetical protein